MILLSNPSSNGSRKINLKPIVFPAYTDIVKQDSVENHFENAQVKLASEVEELQTQLTQLRQSISSERAAFDSEIEEAKRIFEKEKKQAEETARNKGYQVGYDEGTNQAFIDFSDRLHQANELIYQAEQEREIIIDKAESDILGIAMAAAKKIVGSALLDKEAMLNIVQEGIKHCHNQPILRIFTSIDDFNLVNEHTDELNRLLDDGVSLSIHPNETFSQGHCEIETPHGKVDLSVDTQLEKISTALFEAMEELRRES